MGHRAPGPAWSQDKGSQGSLSPREDFTEEVLFEDGVGTVCGCL